MNTIEQGDLLHVSGISFPVIVVSNSFFNQSGMVIACPIVKCASDSPLHIPLKDSSIEGYVLCEQVRYIDLHTRHYSKLAASHDYDIMNISDAVMGMFDYQQL